MFWNNRDFFLITSHKKEQVIAPILQEFFGVQLTVIKADTDSLGTFSGEIERQFDPLTTLRKKIKLAQLPADAIVLASEGSFGPHPNLYFVQSDDELILLYDKLNDLEIIGRKLSTETNFNQNEISSWHELQSFAEKAQFPKHALILSDTQNKQIIKGISTISDLKKTFEELRTTSSKIKVKTDMRAHFNPTRMTVIREAMLDLVSKMNSYCPTCQTPGWSIKSTIKGLRCEWCGSPTESVKAYVKSCDNCNCQEIIEFPNGKNRESPEYCSNCNP